MNGRVEVKKTSSNTAECSEFLLRDKNNSKVIFKPTLVVNSRNPIETVKGKFIYIKDNVTKSDEVLLSPQKMVKSQWMELDLHSDEIMSLFNHLTGLYGIEELDNVTYIRIDTNKEKFLNFFNDKPEIFKEILIEEQTLDLILESEEILIALSNHQDLLKKIINLDDSDLNCMITNIQMKAIENICNLIKSNINNADEEFWQRDIFTAHAWILSQLVAKPIVLFKDKAYLGGKTISNDCGKVIDYIYKNNLNDNIVLFEIKTPVTPLMTKSVYRNEIYSASKELSGSIIQCLVYKDTIQKQYMSLKIESKVDFEVLNPKSFVIIGNMGSLNAEQKKSFELYRREFRDVEVVTFDEILDRLTNLYKCLR